MRLIELAATAPARYAVAFAALTTLIMGGLLAVIYWSMVSLNERQLEHAIEQQLQVLQNDLVQDGRDSLVGLVRQHAEKHRESAVHFLVRDGTGKVLAGDLPPVPSVEGWHEITLPSPNGEMEHPPLRLRAFGEWLDANTFVLVTHDTADLRQSRGLIISSFAIALGVTVLLALGGGFAISAMLLGRVDDINRTAQAIMDGDLSQRIAEVGPGNAFAGLPESINRMLGRMEDLMANVRHVTEDIAHDLRTPLARLRQGLEACRTKPRGRLEYEAAMDNAVEHVDTILKTFDGMLRIAQIHAGAGRSRFATVNLSAVVENVIETFTAVAEEDHKCLEARVEQGVMVEGDQQLLTQMLVNLVENALRHTPSNTVVGVRLDFVEEARITVSDTGPGIPAAERERVFQRFYRLDASRSTPGSGLGLSLAEAIVHLHGSTISLADNRPGLRVTIAFPRTAWIELIQPADDEPQETGARRRSESKS